MESTASQILRGLSDDDWTRLIKELGRYAISRSRRLSWRTENAWELPGGETVDSIVSKAIRMVVTGAYEYGGDEDVHAGVRRWDPQKNPDFKKYLMDVIKSLLNHLATSEENTKFMRLPEGVSDNGSSGDLRVNGPKIPWSTNSPSNPEQVLMSKETEDLSERALEMLAEKASSDPTLTAVISSMRRGHGTPREISKDTGLSVTAVYCAIKRLDRKAAIVRRELVSSGHLDS